MPITVETFNNILNAQGWAAAEDALMAAGGTFGEPEAQAFAGFDPIAEGIGLEGLTDPNYIPQGAITAAALNVPDAQPRQFDYISPTGSTVPVQVESGSGQSPQINNPSDLSAQFIEDVVTNTPAPVVDDAPAVLTQTQKWAAQFGQPGSANTGLALNRLSDDEVRRLAGNPEFVKLYPRIQQILNTRDAAAETEARNQAQADALTAEQSKWTNNYGAPGSQKAMDFIMGYPANEFANMTQDFKDFYSIEYAARVIADKESGSTVIAGESANDTILGLINAGNVVRADQLTEITDLKERTDAALQLAKNIVTKYGNNQQANDLITGLFFSYFDTPDSGGYGAWAESVGLTGLGDTIQDNTELEGIGLELEGQTDPNYVPTGANEGAGPMTADATFTVADIDAALSSGAITTTEAIAKFRELNTPEGNSRAAALEAGTGTGTALPTGAMGDPGTGNVQPGVAGTAQDRLNRIFQQSATRGGRRDLFDAFSATQGGTPLQRAARNLSFDPLSASFAISQASDPSFNTFTDPEGVIRANPNSFRDFLVSGEGGGMPQRLGTSAMSDAFKEFGSLYGNNNLSALDEARRDFISNAGQNLATEYLASQVNPMFRSNIAGAVGRRFDASRDTDPLGDPFGGFLGRYGF